MHHRVVASEGRPNTATVAPKPSHRKRAAASPGHSVRISEAERYHRIVRLQRVRRKHTALGERYIEKLSTIGSSRQETAAIVEAVKSLTHASPQTTDKISVFFSQCA